MSPPSLVLIVPCCNEARRLDGQAFLDFTASHPDVRLLFVDDGSDDGTSEIADRFKDQARGRVDVIHLPKHQGKAPAVREGILEALRHKPDLVGLWDAGPSTPLDVIDDFFALAAKRPEMEILLGARAALT